jgi:phosphoserine phosphatase RsbX
VISLISVDAAENTITWAGVGSVVGMLLPSDVSAPRPFATIPLQAGVVGFRLPRLQAAVTPIAQGDLLILATDGIRRDFVQAFSPDDEPAGIAEYILSNYSKEDDSRLVLVARYIGQRE